MGRPVGASGGSGQCITQTSTKVFAAGRSVHFVEFPPEHRESDRLWNRLPLVGVVTKPPQMPVAESGQGSEGALALPGAQQVMPALHADRAIGTPFSGRRTGSGTDSSASRCPAGSTPRGHKTSTIVRFWPESTFGRLKDVPIRCCGFGGMIVSNPIDFCHVIWGSSILRPSKLASGVVGVGTRMGPVVEQACSVAGL